VSLISAGLRENDIETRDAFDHLEGSAGALRSAGSRGGKGRKK